MRIIFRYLFTTCLRYTLGMYFGFALLQIGQQVIVILDNLPNIALQQLAYLVLLLTPDSLNDIAPIALTLAVLLTGNQLYSQSEIYILRGSGLNPVKTASPILAVGLVVGIVMTINASYLKPLASLKLSKLTFDITNSNFTEYLIPGEFRYLKSLDLTITANDNKNGQLQDVFIHKAADKQIITGKKAYIIDQGPFRYSLNIEHGSLLTYSETEISQSDFDKYSASVVRTQFKAKDSVEFYDSFDLLKRPGAFPRTELNWRLSRFLYCLTLTGIALLFIPKSPRSGTSLAILGGIIMYFIFNDIANSYYWKASRGKIDMPGVFWLLYPTIYFIVLLSRTAISKTTSLLYRAF